MRRPAFTLLEVMVASTMAIIIITAATSSVMMITRTLNQTGQSSAMVSEVQLLSEFLVAQVQGIGGGAIRPWMVTTVENNVGPGNADVFSFGDVPATSPQSATIMAHSGGGVFSLFVPGPPRGRVLGRCGLSDLRRDTNNDGLPEGLEDTAAAFPATELVGRQVILISPSGETWRSVILQAVGLDATPTGCFVRFAGGDAGLIANGAFTGADRFSRASDSAEDLQQWVGGQVAFVRAREWRFEPGSPGVPGRLVERLTEQGVAEERVLFEGVLDLQIAVGYDFDPFDGVLRESADNRDDEWINHSPSDNHRVRSIPDGLADVDISRELIRMIEVGVVVALPQAERKLTVQALDGNPHTGPEARVVGGRAYLRNLLLFL